MPCRKLILPLVLLLVISALSPLARADNSPATQPAEGSRVAILPFDVLGPAEANWIGKGIQQGLASGVQQDIHAPANSIESTGASTAAGAIAAGKTSGADYVVFGSCQVLGDQLRIDGQIINVATASVAGTLRLDGNAADLFSMEDALADKIARVITPANPPVASTSANPMPTATLPEIDAPPPANQPRYFDGDLSAVLHPPAQFQDQADRYFNGQPIYPYCYYGYYYNRPYYFGYNGGFGNGNFAPTFGPD